MLTFAIYGPITRPDLPGLCGRVCALLEHAAPQVALCDVRGVPADAVTVDALAQLQLAARRRGCEGRLQNTARELRDLVHLMGLAEVVVDDDATR